MLRKVELLVLFIFFGSTLLVYTTNITFSSLEIVGKPPENFAWVVHGTKNILGYATVFLPGYLVFKYVKRINYLNKSGRSLFGGIIRTCFGDDELILVNTNAGHAAKLPRTAFEDGLLLLFYFLGLQVSYLSWGVLQEKVMTQKYEAGGQEGYFKNSQFLVFVNRILAFAFAALTLCFTKQPRHRCPLYKYTYCSFSNIMSSWCQYEALKYVSFPHQVLAKASKTIPVMIMGKIVSKTKYEYYEYVTAVILSIGMLFFMVDAGNDRATSAVTTFSGAILLVLYIVFDSFTSNWQGRLFKVYEMKPVQMMCFVNFFSCVFTAISLAQQGGFLDSIRFMFQFPSFILDAVVLSICSAGGQMFIFCTISAFGPLVFAIISTIRQGLSVLLSCVIYHHEVGLVGILGVVLVFCSVLLRIYCKFRIKTKGGQEAVA